MNSNNNKIPNKKVRFADSNDAKDNFKKRINKPNQANFNKDGKKKTSGRGGHPKYGWKAQNSEPQEENSKKFNKSSGKSKFNAKPDRNMKKGKKVLGSKINKNKSGFRKKR